MSCLWHFTTSASCLGAQSGLPSDASLPGVCSGLGQSVGAVHCSRCAAGPIVCPWWVPLDLLWKMSEDIKLFTKYENRSAMVVQCCSGTYTVLMSSGFGTQLSRCESSWKAWLWGSNINRPYRALMRYGLCSTSSSCRRRSAKRTSVSVESWKRSSVWETVCRNTHRWK